MPPPARPYASPSSPCPPTDLEDIRAAVLLIQRPMDVDTAAVLAHLQEQVSDLAKQRDFKRFNFAGHTKPSVKSALPLPLAPSAADRVPVAKPDDRKLATTYTARPMPDKWSAIRAYRRAHGLCDRCAEKWSRGHRCPDSVQLHVCYRR